MGKVFTSAEIDINAKDKTGAGIKSASSKITDLGKSLSNVGKKMSLFVTAPLVAMGVVALKNAASFEKQTVAFETLLGSAQRAKTLLKDIEDFAATTPFQMPGLLEGSKRLIAFGIGADEIVDKMTNLGNAAMGNQAILDRLTLAYGKLRAKGKATLEELNMFMEAGVPILDELAKMYDVTTQEMFEMISGGKIGFEQVDQALTNLTTGAGRFAGMIEKQSKTLSGLWSTLKDNLGILGREIMETVLPAFKAFTERLTKLVMWFRELDPRAKKMIVVIAGIAAAMGPLLFVIGKLIAIAPALIGAIAGIGTAMQIAMGPVGWITLAIAGAATAAILLYKNWDKVSGWLADVWYWLRDIAIQVWAKIGKVLVTPLLLYLDAIIKITEFFKKGDAEKLRNVYDKIAGSVDQAREHTEKYERKTWDVIRAERELKEETEALMRSMESGNAIVMDTIDVVGEYADGVGQVADDLEDSTVAMDEFNASMVLSGEILATYISGLESMWAWEKGITEAIDEGAISVMTYSERIGLLSEQIINIVEATKKLRKEMDKIKDTAEEQADKVFPYWSQAWSDMGDTTVTVYAAMKNAFKNVIGDWLMMKSKEALVEAFLMLARLRPGQAAMFFTASALAAAASGAVRSLAEGGIIPGYGGGDIVPAMLEPGEMVIRKEIVREAQQGGGGEEIVIHNHISIDGDRLGKWITHASRNKQVLTYKGAIVNV